MDLKFLDELGEEYNSVRQRFYSVLKGKTSLNEEEEFPFKEATFDVLKKFKYDKYKETPLTSWKYELNQLFKDSDKLFVVYNKMQTVTKKEIDKIPKMSYQKGRPCVYHLCFCEDLKKLTVEARKKGWVSVRPFDGYLTIVQEDGGKHRSSMKTNKIKVCPKCFEALQLGRLGYCQLEFDLKKFLREYPPIESIKMPSIDDVDDTIDQNTEVWTLRRKKLLLRVYKNTCIRCKTRYRDASQLEIHHKNKDHLDNRLDNLEVLCKWCYDKEHPNRPQ